MNIRRRLRRSKLGRRWADYRKMRKGSPIRQELESLERAYQLLIQGAREDDDDSPFWTIVRENYPERIRFILTDLPDMAGEILMEEIDRWADLPSEMENVIPHTRARFSAWFDQHAYSKLEETADQADKLALTAFADWFYETTGAGGYPWQSISWFKTQDVRRRLADTLRLRVKPLIEERIASFDLSVPQKGGRLSAFWQRRSKRAAARRKALWEERVGDLKQALGDEVYPMVNNAILLELFAVEVQDILAESVRREKQFILDHSF